jgi:glycosyltransferase involved in cell wall biosynthesis
VNSSHIPPRSGVTIVIADTTGRYDGRDLERRPLGGTESSVIHMARALARRGHRLTVLTNCEAPIEDHGVRWQPFSDPLPTSCDLYVPAVHPKLLGLVPARRTAIWCLWRVNNLKHHKQLPRMWRHRPIPVLMSLFQARDYSPVLPPRKPHIVIPLGLPHDVRGFAPLEAPPPPHCVFASNPTRNLRRLVELWGERILPQRPDARLRVFGSMHKVGDPWRELGGLLPPASERVKASIEFVSGATRQELIAAERSARAMLYLGHKTEAFCLALAEAQAVGLPCVVAPIAVLPERVIDNVTGFVRGDEAEFCERALALLNDDALWRSQHEAALRLQRGISWDEAAARFEHALLSDMIPTDRA